VITFEFKIGCSYLKEKKKFASSLINLKIMTDSLKEERKQQKE
jgi:hypothetical protein